MSKSATWRILGVLAATASVGETGRRLLEAPHFVHVWHYLVTRVKGTMNSKSLVNTGLGKIIDNVIGAEALGAARVAVQPDDATRGSLDTAIGAAVRGTWWVMRRWLALAVTAPLLELPTHYIPDWKDRDMLQEVTDVMGNIGAGYITGMGDGTGLGIPLKVLRAASMIGVRTRMLNTALAVEAGPGRWLRRRSLAAPRAERGAVPLWTRGGRPTQ